MLVMFRNTTAFESNIVVFTWTLLKAALINDEAPQGKPFHPHGVVRWTIVY